MQATDDKVVLEKLEYIHERKFGDIIVAPNTGLGCNLTKAKVKSVGSIAKEKGFKPGDIVLYDHFSCYYNVHPTVVVKVMNVICKFEDDVMIPPKGEVVLKQLKGKAELDGIIVPDIVHERLYKTYEVVNFGIDTKLEDVEIGDEVFVSELEQTESRLNRKDELYIFVKLDKIIGKAVK